MSYPILKRQEKELLIEFMDYLTNQDLDVWGYDNIKEYLDYKYGISPYKWLPYLPKENESCIIHSVDLSGKCMVCENLTLDE